MGHSMGGLIVIEYARQAELKGMGSNLAGVIASGTPVCSLNIMSTLQI